MYSSILSLIFVVCVDVVFHQVCVLHSCIYMYVERKYTYTDGNQMLESTGKYTATVCGVC